MSTGRLPKATYLPVPAMLLIQAMFWLTENQIVSNQQIAAMLTSLPLGSMWAIVGAFTTGLIVQDLYNPASWIQRNWRAARRGFELGGLLRRVYENGSYSLSVEIKASKRHRLGTLTVWVSSLRQDGTTTISKREFPWSNTMMGETFEVPLASFSDHRENHGPARMLYWGSAEEVAWGEGDRTCRHIPGRLSLDVEFSSALLKQHETFQIICGHEMGEEHIRLIRETPGEPLP